MIQQITTLYVGWRGPTRGTWYPIGELRAVSDGYTFQYLQGARDAQAKDGFRGVVQFPDFTTKYESEDLFPFVGNRLMPASRPDYQDRIRRLGFDPLAGDLRPFDILSRTNGQRVTDTFELFAQPKARNQQIDIYFFSRGVRYLSDEHSARWDAGYTPKALKLTPDINNEQDPHALQILDADNVSLGYVPRYYTPELARLITQNCKSEVTLAHYNRGSNFIRERFLIRFQSDVPSDWKFPQIPAYDPISKADMDAA